MSLLMLCLSMYSDMSNLMMASCKPNTPRNDTAHLSMAQHGTAHLSMAQHGTAWHSTPQHGTAWHSTPQHGTAWDGTACCRA
jgi:hypothetical protein